MPLLEKIDLFHGLNINPIPLEFSQGLTTTEMLAHMQSVLNKIVDMVNSLEDVASDYTDTQIATLKELIELKEVELKHLIEVVEVNCNKYTDEQILIISNMFNNKINDINTLISVINLTLENMRLDIVELFNIVEHGGMSVVNPTTGKHTSIQDALNSIYNSIRVTLTWEEIDALGLTWEEVENLKATWDAIEYNITVAFGIEVETTALLTNL